MRGPKFLSKKVEEHFYFLGSISNSKVEFQPLKVDILPNPNPNPHPNKILPIRYISTITD
jgi:hypothetical protein